MTADQPGFGWANLFDPEQVTDASEEVAEQQRKLFQQMMSATTPAGGNGLTGLGALCTNTGSFKTRVQSGGRISIPDAEREALDIEEGDIVQTIVVPVSRDRTDD